MIEPTMISVLTTGFSLDIAFCLRITMVHGSQTVKINTESQESGKDSDGSPGAAAPDQQKVKLSNK